MSTAFLHLRGPGVPYLSKILTKWSARLYSHSTTIIPTLAPELRKAAVDSYADALHVVFICQAVVNLMCFLCCLPIQENTLPYVQYFSRECPCAGISTDADGP